MKKKCLSMKFHHLFAENRSVITDGNSCFAVHKDNTVESETNTARLRVPIFPAIERMIYNAIFSTIVPVNTLLKELRAMPLVS